MIPEVLELPQRLAGQTVFLSASKPSRPLRFLPPGTGPIRETMPEIEAAALSLARAVFAEGGGIVFGAHPSISPLIAAAAGEYFPPDWSGQSGRVPVQIYQSKAFDDVVPESTKALARFGYTRLSEVEQVEGERFKLELRGQEQCLKSLAEMRHRMFTESRPLVMVAIGGMEGVIREARLFLRMFERGHVFALRTTGGVSRHLADCVSETPLPEDRPLEPSKWRGRLHVVEDEFPFDNWSNAEGRRDELPMAPYALMMQRLVETLAEGV
jgi:hypothetical protein